MGSWLRLLNLQKDISDYDLLIDNYDSSDRRRSLFSVIYRRKSRDRTHLSFLRQINSNPCLICLSTCLSPRQQRNSNQSEFICGKNSLQLLHLRHQLGNYILSATKQHHRFILVEKLVIYTRKTSIHPALNYDCMLCPFYF